jgi:hypothetical protein
MCVCLCVCVCVCGLGQRSRYSDSLQVGRSLDRIQVVAKFFRTCLERLWGAPILQYNGYSAFLGVKRPDRVADDPPLSNAEVKERVNLYLNSASKPSWPVVG